MRASRLLAERGPARSQYERGYGIGVNATAVVSGVIGANVYTPVGNAGL
jgi:hypothetical protein